MGLRWSDESYVRLFTRDTADWLSLNWKAQGLFALILRKVDRAGMLDLGRHGHKGLCHHIGGPSAWPEVEPMLEELLKDGCIEIHGQVLVVRNYIEAQTAITSDAQRKREQRERDRLLTREDVTKRDQMSRSVTRGHEVSQSVTLSSAVLSSADLNKTDLTTLAQLPKKQAPKRDVEKFDFEALYKNYPLKLGKAKGLTTCRAKITTQEKYEQLRSAIANYTEHCRDKEAKYIKHFSTFMNCWEDWVAVPDGINKKIRKYENDVHDFSQDPQGTLTLEQIDLIMQKDGRFS